MKFLIVISIFVFASHTLQAQEEEILNLNAGFTGDWVTNFDGGIKKGSTTLELLEMSLLFNTENAKLWKGGQFFIHGHAPVGGKPSQNLIGDVQIASNIEGTTSKFIYELWYKQTIGDFSLLAGFQNMNEDFFVSSNAGLYLNSSFGIGPSVSLTNFVSIYPSTTLGGLVKFAKEDFTLLAGIYNHGNKFVEEDHFQLKNHIFNQGYYALAEAQIRPKDSNGEYKIGVLFRKCLDVNLLENKVCIRENNYGAYFIADQNVKEFQNGTKLSIFSQIGYKPFKYDKSPLCLAGGINFNGLLTKKHDDEIGLAITSVRINELSADGNIFEYAGNETVIELSATFTVHRSISIHPDFQYIMNPSGNNELSNTFVGILRAEINF